MFASTMPPPECAMRLMTRRAAWTLRNSDVRAVIFARIVLCESLCAYL
jgi:hypothetical protein